MNLFEGNERARRKVEVPVDNRYGFNFNTPFAFGRSC
jgi:hypothetical protein